MYISLKNVALPGLPITCAQRTRQEGAKNHALLLELASPCQAHNTPSRQMSLLCVKWRGAAGKCANTP
jgi:hypothetical protein